MVSSPLMVMANPDLTNVGRYLSENQALQSENKALKWVLIAGASVLAAIGIARYIDRRNKQEIKKFDDEMEKSSPEGVFVKTKKQLEKEAMQKLGINEEVFQWAYTENILKLTNFAELSIEERCKKLVEATLSTANSKERCIELGDLLTAAAYDKTKEVSHELKERLKEIFANSTSRHVSFV